jgi:dethiobiotin synthetase
MTPRKLVVLAGTGTEVGKTWVGCRLIEAVRAGGGTVMARKPVQSFDPGDSTTDAGLLASASGEEVGVVCPPHRCYEVAMAPPMAADALGRPRILMAELLDEVRSSWSAALDAPTSPSGEEPAAASVGLVELAGGVRSPIAHDGDGVDMIRALAPDLVIVVADAGLGTVNAVRCTLDSLTGIPARPVVHLNRYDLDHDLHRRNLAWLAAALTDSPAVVTTSVEQLADLVRTAAT